MDEEHVLVDTWRQVVRHVVDVFHTTEGEYVCNPVRVVPYPAVVCNVSGVVDDRRPPFAVDRDGVWCLLDAGQELGVSEDDNSGLAVKRDTGWRKATFEEAEAGCVHGCVVVGARGAWVAIVEGCVGGVDRCGVVADVVGWAVAIRTGVVAIVAVLLSER